MDAFEFAVAHDLGIGVVDLQGAEQGDEGSALGWRAGVGGAAFLVEASFVTDADGVGVVVAGMHADLVFVAGLEYLTVFFDEVVVADAFAVEAGIVAGFEHFNSETLVAAGCRTVKDNEVYFAGHKILFFRGYTTRWACNSGLPEFPEQLLLRLQRFLESLRFWSNLLLSFL